ncbi:hypothetical protein [Bradyrhizobium sp. CCGUVB23]|uniref:hypothetical protein n=1 Tax=Bradyrhizobium sp. CCGUVB23 TaxID=2949630 RepID=UPI0020B41E14|nr:hypothetical protein [Bradyrhizobium sp. CCGUVB23]MCP3467982.1 hypothetical protein [Bradyrhizobium sp. CCGUVB23]
MIESERVEAATLIGYTMLRLFGETLLGLAEWKLGTLLARLLWSGTGVMTESRLDDPVYKKNVQRLIEHHRRFEDSKR